MRFGGRPPIKLNSLPAHGEGRRDIGPAASAPPRRPDSAASPSRQSHRYGKVVEISSSVRSIRRVNATTSSSKIWIVGPRGPSTAAILRNPRNTLGESDETLRPIYTIKAAHVVQIPGGIASPYP